jgi:hypothetical protein
VLRGGTTFAVGERVFEKVVSRGMGLFTGLSIELSTKG